MLGIFSIICLIVWLLIKLKRRSLLNTAPDEPLDSGGPIELDSNIRTYNVCYRAQVLDAISKLVLLVGFLGCVWPYLFIEDASVSGYLIGLFFFGLVPLIAIIVLCYFDLKNANGYIKISNEQIEYKRRKSYTVRIDEIKKISYQGVY